MGKQIKVAINGFGRIGRVLMRILIQQPHIQVVAINDLAPTATLAHLFKYDSVHRMFSGEVIAEQDNITIDGQSIQVFHEKSPEHLPWHSLDIDVVIESTGRFTNQADAGKHIMAGAKRVIISAPGSDGLVKTIVLGVNDSLLQKSDQILSNASCTTNNVAPMLSILDKNWGVQSAYITTVHSYTTDQNLQDAPHKDLRRARAAAQSIIPTTTGAAKAVTDIFPHLKGRLGGAGIRVPVPDGSLTDLTCTVQVPATVDAVNRAFQEASKAELKGILAYTEDPIVSVDVIGNPHSCVFDSQLTSVLDCTLVKVVGWYDNEVGYSNRLAELILRIGQH